MREKFRIVRTVLEQGGHFSGINRKARATAAFLCVACL